MKAKVISREERRRAAKNPFVFASAFVVFLAVLAVVSILSSRMILAGSESGGADQKYYTSIEIEEGDTLWSIASEYMSPDHYDSINDYIVEIKEMNGISSDTIHSGNHLIVSYYSEEIK